MNKTILTSLVLSALMISSAQADDCQDAIFGIHNALSSKTSLDVASAFFGTFVANDLGLTGITKDIFQAYTSSDEVKNNNNQITGATQKFLQACKDKPRTCTTAGLSIINNSGNARNAYALALAENTLAKRMNSGPLFEASQKSADLALEAYTKVESPLVSAAVQACK